VAASLKAQLERRKTQMLDEPKTAVQRDKEAKDAVDKAAAMAAAAAATAAAAAAVAKELDDIEASSKKKKPSSSSDVKAEARSAQAQAADNG
jgi:hypothetical protein